ncbi:MAG: hypothetical protein WCE50_13220 [Candidatus Acidiferrum sp.]
MGSAAFAGALLSASFSGAQQNQTPVAQANTSYDVRRETVVRGTVISFTASSVVPPFGAHVTIQTSGGPLEVHLGNISTLKQGNIFLTAGDSVSIVGENLPFGSGSIFAARVLQKGSQSVTLRNLKGVPLSPVRPAAASGARIRRRGVQ